MIKSLNPRIVNSLNGHNQQVGMSDRKTTMSIGSINSGGEPIQVLMSLQQAQELASNNSAAFGGLSS